MFEKNYQKFCARFCRVAPKTYREAFKRRQIIKFLIAGGTATSTDILIYYVLIYLAGLWYIASSISSFIIAFWISFSLQKFWTFRDKNTQKIMRQTYFYFFVAIANLGISTLLIYSLVDYMNIHKLLSKIFANAIIAAESFFVYRHFIFAKRDKAGIKEIGQELNLP